MKYFTQLLNARSACGNIALKNWDSENCIRSITPWLIAGLATGLGTVATAVRWEDLPVAVRTASPAFANANLFDQFRRRVNRETEERVCEGERESRVYYVLQSTLFTTANPIEPAVAAGNWAAGQPIPPAAQRRIDDFLRACEKPPTDQRFRYLCDLDCGASRWERDFAHAMSFLREKEHRSHGIEGDDRRNFVAGLYRERGLSSDSGFDANFPVYLALRALAGKSAAERVTTILIVGPGLEFAPRTGLIDSAPPQSLQPFAVMDALLQLGLASPETLTVHSVDVNPRVVAYFHRERVSPLSLTIFKHDGPDEYRRYYESFCRSVGTASGSTAASRTIQIRAATARSIRASRLNVITEREQPSPGYDLVIATNVLLYMRDPEFLLAMANIHSMLPDGGYFLHNELRADVEQVGSAIGMPVIDARLVRLRQDDKRAILDSQVLQRKQVAP